jgi:hypothetical protein
MDWATLEAISTFLTALVAIWTVFYVVKQVREAKKARILEAYLMFEGRLVTEKAREDRKYLYEHKFDNPPTITAEERKTIERVCSTFDILGVLVREGLMYRPLVFKPFYDVIIKCWLQSCDYIEYERSPARKAETYMQDFEYLYKQAEKYREENKFQPVTIHPPVEPKA